MGTERAETNGNGELAGEIASAMVQILSHYLGRGPTRARATIDRELISVVMQDTLTPAERRLVESGQRDVVRTARRALRETMRQDRIQTIEHLTGRRVVAVLSDNELDPDVLVLNFVLDPPEQERRGARRSAGAEQRHD